MSSTTESIIVRPAVEDDLDAVFIMIIKLSDYQKLNKPLMSLPSFKRDSGLTNPDDRKYFELLVVEETKSKKLIGYALFYYIYKTCTGLMIDFEDFFIESEYRGSGSGRKLFREVASIALKTNCKGIVLRALKWNPAVSVYEKFGGKRTADISNESWQFTFDESTLNDLITS